MTRVIWAAFVTQILTQIKHGSDGYTSRSGAPHFRKDVILTQSEVYSQSFHQHRMLQNIFLVLDRQYFTAQVGKRWWNGVQYERVCPQTFEFQCCVRGQQRSVRLVFCHDWSLNRKNCSHHEHSLLVKGFSIFEIALRCSRPARGLFIMATFHQPLQRLS